MGRTPELPPSLSPPPPPPVTHRAFYYQLSTTMGKKVPCAYETRQQNVGSPRAFPRTANDQSSARNSKSKSKRGLLPVIGRGRASLGIMLGSGSDPGVILSPGSCIPAVFWLVGIQLVVSRRIPAETCSAGLKYWVVAPLITTNLTTNRTGFRRFSASTSPQHLQVG